MGLIQKKVALPGFVWVDRERVVAAIRANELPLGIMSTDLIGGFEGIKWRYVEDLEGAVARVRFDVVSEHRGSRRPGNIAIRVDAQGASALGEAYDSVGHELRHLSEDNIVLSDVDPLGPALSPQEADAVRYGMRTRLIMERKYP